MYKLVHESTNNSCTSDAIFRSYKSYSSRWEFAKTGCICYSTNWSEKFSKIVRPILVWISHFDMCSRKAGLTAYGFAPHMVKRLFFPVTPLPSKQWSASAPDLSCWDERKILPELSNSCTFKAASTLIWHIKKRNCREESMALWWCWKGFESFSIFFQDTVPHPTRQPCTHPTILK